MHAGQTGMHPSGLGARVFQDMEGQIRHPAGSESSGGPKLGGTRLSARSGGPDFALEPAQTGVSGLSSDGLKPDRALTISALRFRLCGGENFSHTLAAIPAI